MPDRRLLLVLVVVIAGCVAIPGDPPIAGQWRVVSVDGAVTTDPRPLSLSLGGGRFTLDFSCNPVSGSAVVEGGRLVVREWVLGAIACPPAPPAERGIFRVLTSSPWIALVEGRLVLRSAAGEVVLERLAP